MNGSITIHGKIIASQLGTFGPTGKLFGYTTIRQEDGTHVRLKVDSHTECESIAVGDTVEVHVDELGETGILIARRVALIPGPFYSHEESKAST
jgi:hypothetical protein